MKSWFLACAVLISSAITPSADAQDYLPPEELVDRALSEHPDVAAGRARLDGSRREADRLNAGPGEWTLSGSYLRRTVTGVGDFAEYDMGLSRAFRLPGKSELDRQIGILGIDAAKNAAEDARHRSALQLMMGWMTWLSARETNLILEDQLLALQKEVQAVEKRLSVDDAASVDLEMARSALSEANAAVARSNGDVQRSEAFLRAWFPSIELPANPAPIAPPVEPVDADQLSVLVLEHSHEIEYVEALARKAATLAERARADQAPDPVLGVRAFSERNGEETGIGLTFALPLGGGARNAATFELFAAAAAAKQEAQRVRRSVAEAARSDAIGTRSEYQAWLLSSAALEDSTSAIARQRSGFDLGAIGLSDLLLAEQRHLAVRRLEAEARSRSSVARLRLRIDAHELWVR